MTKLHFLVDESGMNLTYALLNTIIKYPVASTEIRPDSDDIKERKMGYYFADQDIFREIVTTTGAGRNRHPLTFILEAADDIAYKTADIEDAFVKGFLSYHKLLEELAEIQKKEEKLYGGNGGFRPADKMEELYRRGRQIRVEDPEEYAVKNWIVKVQGFLIGCATYGFTSHYNEIMRGEYRKDLFFGTYAQELMELLGDLAYREVFISEPIYRMEVTEAVMLDYLMDRFMAAVIKYDDETQKLNSIDERMVSFISSNYKKAYHYHARGRSEDYRLYLRILLATDYICGMTDSYAKRLYQELKAIL